jgi:hypothetical protein
MSKEAKIIVGTFFFGIAIAVGVYLGRGPWQLYQKQREQAIKSEAMAVKAENTRVELARKNAEIEGATGRDRLAREQGLLKKNEEPIEKAP